MANITDGSQAVVPSHEDKNPDSDRSKSVKRTKRLEMMADELKRVKHELAALKKKDRCEGEENEEVNGSEAAANEDIDGIDGDANEEEYESEGDENEEEDGNEGDENEEGSEGDVNEEGGSEGVQNEEDMNGGDENQKLADRGDDNKHEQKVQEGAGKKEKVDVMITKSVTVEGNINGDGGKGGTAATDVSTNSEKGEAVMVKEGKDVKNSAKEENMAVKKAKRARRRRNPTTDAATSKEDNKSDELLNASKNEALTVEEVKMVDGMGLIFMCNGKTKQDCFRYKILGLPASKKELVAKIYKGMRLFLFDVDLKLMYGIFKAAAPGGYNIEPQAFKSAYPAQVRFQVLNDCLPLPEEKFKAAIKENYFGRNKFSNQLSSEQVKKLCKIFQTASKPSKNKRPRGDVNVEAEPTPSSKRRRRAKMDAIRTARPDPRTVQRAADAIRAKPALGPRTSSHGRGRDSINHREAHKRVHPERERRRRTPPASLPSRRQQLEHGIRGRELGPYIGRREREIQDLLPPPRRVLSPPPAPIAAAAVPYDYYYRQDPPHSFMVDPRSHSRVMDSETRHMLLPHDSLLTEYHHHHRDALGSLYREPPQSLYHAPPTAYAPPPSLSAYGHAQSPLYYRY